MVLEPTGALESGDGRSRDSCLARLDADREQTSCGPACPAGAAVRIPSVRRLPQGQAPVDTEEALLVPVETISGRSLILNAGELGSVALMGLSTKAANVATTPRLKSDAFAACEPTGRPRTKSARNEIAHLNSVSSIESRWEPPCWFR